MKRWFQIAGLILLCASVVRAQDDSFSEGPPPEGQVNEESAIQPGQAVEAIISVQPKTDQPAQAEPEPAEPEIAPLPPGSRDPFWPIGWVPPVERPEEERQTTAQKNDPAVGQLETPEWDVALRTMVIKGVMKAGAGYMAVINGQVASENDTVSTKFKGRIYTWRVASISQRGVRFERMELGQ